MKRKLFILALICSLLLPLRVNAACSDQEIIRLQKIANNISESKTYREVNGKVVFDITLTNLTNDVYVYDFVRNTNLYYTGSPITLYGYNSGMTIEYVVKSNYNGCRGDSVRTFSVVLPSYNQYYNNELCQGISSYKLCNKWYNTRNLAYKDFERQVKAYRESLNKPVTPKPIVQPKPTWQEVLFELIADYYLFVLIPIIIMAGGGIYILKQKEEII